MQDCRSLTCRRSASMAEPIADIAWMIEPRRGGMHVSPMERSSISPMKGTASCRGERPVSSRVLSRKYLMWQTSLSKLVNEKGAWGCLPSESRTRQNQAVL